MTIFKAVLRVISRRPTYLLVYAGWLSIMGLFIASSISPAVDDGSFESYRVDVAVVDRDGSELSQALSDHLNESHSLVFVEDEPFALQDAVATGLADCLLIVPEGFGEAYVDAARNGGTAPVVEAAYGSDSMKASLADQDAARFLSLVAASAALDREAPLTTLIEQAKQASEESAAVETVSSANAAKPADQFAFYLQWCTYTLTASIVVCVGVLMNSFNHTDLRRRNISSPVSTLSYGLQLALGCLVLTVLIWVFCIGMGLAAFGSSLADVAPAGIALTLAASFAFALVPLGIGFLLGQLGANEPVANASGNVMGMLMAFLGGAWISLDLLAPEVQAVSHFIPTSWFSNAVHQAVRLESANWDAVLPILGDIGVVLLFAAALFAMALVAGKLRVTSAEAGGNAAAARA